MKSENRAFVKNLKLACDWSKDVPSGWGRQAWIASKLGLSQESISQWFEGKSRPVSKNMRHLALLLNVDESWLALDKKPIVTKVEEKIFQDDAQATVYFVIYLLRLMRYQVAFASETDDFDLLAIKDGKITKVAVSTGMLKSQRNWLVPVTYDHEAYLNLAVIVTTPERPDVFVLEPVKLSQYAQHVGGAPSIPVNFTKELGFHTEDHRWSTLAESGFFDK